MKTKEIKALAAKFGTRILKYSNNPGDSFADEAKRLRKQGRLVWCETSKKGSHLYEVNP